MSLLAFSKVEESPDADVLEYSKRHQLATEINDEILEKECTNHGICIIRKTTASIYKGNALGTEAIQNNRAHCKYWRFD
jgi:hypothetical protein